MRSRRGRIVSMKRSLARGLLALIMLAACTAGLAQSDPFEARRLQMVRQDIEGRGIRDTLVLNAMRKVPRHLFVEESLRSQAYNDYPLPIGERQTISQPYVVALMTEALRLKGGERVLEVGTGSGYQASILAEIAKEVFTIEIRPELYEKTRDKLEKMGYRNIRAKLGDGYLGWPEHAPFDAIIITASTDRMPPPLFYQLKEGGRMIMPLGSTTFHQKLTLVTKKQGKAEVKELDPVAFVPLVREGQSK